MRSLIRFGLLTGFLVGAWNLSCFTIVSWLNHFFSLEIPAARIRAYSGLFGIIILVVGVYLGIREAKRKNGNQISYGHAFKIGVGISILTAIIVGFFGFVYCTWINPGYADFMVRDAEASLKAAGKTPADISHQLDSVRQQFSTSTQVVQALVAQSVVGTIASLITASVVRTKNKNGQ